MKSKPIFNELLSKHNSENKYSTLSGRSYFYVITKGNSFEITNSKNKTRLIHEAEFAIVFARYEELKRKKMQQKSSYYTDTHWKNSGCPNRIFSPYLARLIDSHQNPQIMVKKKQQAKESSLTSNNNMDVFTRISTNR
jgi:hypothetical protein